MNYVIKLVAEYQENKSDLIFEDLANELKDTINGHRNRVPQFYRDDFHQELLECLLNVVTRFNIKTIKNIPISLFNDKNLELLVKHNFKNISEVLNNKYLLGFTEKYGNDLLMQAFQNNDKLIFFLNEFELFCNENQFMKYINTSFDRKVKLFYRELKKDEKNKCISLNINVIDEIELLDLISVEASNEDVKLFYDETLLSEDNKRFLNLFIEEGNIITGKKVVTKLNITQQAVSSRLKRLKKKYIDEFNKKYRKEEN